MRNGKAVWIWLAALVLVTTLLWAQAKVTEAVICTSVEQREPKGAGETFSADVGQLYCFTRIEGAAGTTIKHAWYWQDAVQREIPLSIGGSPWRTWSQKNIQPMQTGAWRVDIVAEDGTVLKSVKFTVEKK
jgi:hypothetical protein